MTHKLVVCTFKKSTKDNIALNTINDSNTPLTKGVNYQVKNQLFVKLPHCALQSFTNYTIQRGFSTFFL